MLGRLRQLSPAVAAGWGVVILVLLAIPLVTDTFTTYEYANVGVYVIAIIGLNLLTGYSGQISLGNGAFMAVGAYSAGLLMKDAQWPYLATIPVAGLLAGVIGFLFGIPALRLSGIYLALATFALALAVPPLINNYEGFTYGNGGVILKGIKAPVWLAGLFSTEQYQYYLMWLIAGLLFLFARAVMRSRTGRAFMAIRDSETAAVASGVSLAYYKTLAFGLSAFYAGVAGALLTILTAFAHPNTYSFTLSIELLVALVVGGLANDLGPLIGGLVLVWLPFFAEKTANLRLGAITIPGKPDVFYGMVLIAIVFLAPAGVAGLLNRLLRRYRGARAAAREAAVPDVLAAVTEPEAADASEAGS